MRTIPEKVIATIPDRILKRIPGIKRQGRKRRKYNFGAKMGALDE